MERQDARSEKSGLFFIFGVFSRKGGTKRTPLENTVFTGFFIVSNGKNGLKRTPKRLKNSKKGYETYLPKSLVSRYHNTREVATHKIRNTVTHGKGYSPGIRDNCTRSLPRQIAAHPLPFQD